MVSRETILKYGTLALILFFVFEAFFPLLYAPAPTDASASPTSLPAGASFQATGTTRANVTRLENVGFAPCDPTAAADKIILNDSGVKQAYYSASNALAVEFFPNATVSEIAFRVLVLCQSPMYRVAVVAPDGVTLKGENQTQVVTAAQFRSLEAQNGLPGLRAFILPETRLGAVINVTVSGTISNGQLSSLIVEESAPPLVSLPSPAGESTMPAFNDTLVNETVVTSSNQSFNENDNQTSNPSAAASSNETSNQTSNPTTAPLANQTSNPTASVVSPATTPKPS